MIKRILWIGLLAAVLACSNDNQSDSGGTTDAGTVTDSAGQDAGGVDAGSGDSGNADSSGSQQDAGAQPVEDPKPLGKAVSKDKATAAPVGTWVYAIHKSGATVTSAIASGTFTVPKAGTSAYNLNWLDAKANDKGEIGPFGSNGQGVWLAMAPDIKEPTTYIARVDNVQFIYGGKRRRPGDIYGHGMARVPLHLNAGESFVAMGRGGRKVKLPMQTSKAELWLNPHDQTFSDLREDHDDPSWLGLPLLNLRPKTVSEIHVRVIENDHFKASNTVWPGIAPLAVTHVGVHLRPKKAWPKAGDKDNPVKIPIKLRVEAKDADMSYELDIERTIVAVTKQFRQSYRSKVDGSIQYYGVREPQPFDPAKKYAMVLSLHGAGVAGIGQAGSYGPKDWVYIIAPTNRRRFGFDHEEWGHLQDLASHDDALARFPIDPLRKYVSGHSMGGHGTWQFGIHHAHEFALVGPSAGWDSFYTYGGSKKPQHPLLRARAHSDSSRYIRNLTNRTVYVIHGTADNNVP